MSDHTQNKPIGFVSEINGRAVAIGPDHHPLVLKKGAPVYIQTRVETGNDASVFIELVNGKKIDFGGDESIKICDHIHSGQNEAFDEFRIWLDRGDDDVTDESKLITLKEADIVSPSQDHTDIQENAENATGNAPPLLTDMVTAEETSLVPISRHSSTADTKPLAETNSGEKCGLKGDDIASLIVTNGTVAIHQDLGPGDLYFDIGQTTDLTSWGEAIELKFSTFEGDHLISGIAGEDEIFTFTLNSSNPIQHPDNPKLYNYKYEFELKEPIDRPATADDSIEGVQLALKVTTGYAGEEGLIQVKIADSLLVSRTGETETTVNDDEPDTVVVPETHAPGIDTNIVLAIDTSAGMALLQNSLEAAKSLIDGYDIFGNTRVKIIEFNSSGSSSRDWISTEQAKMHFDGITTNNLSGTDYSMGIKAVMQETDVCIGADQTVLYVIANDTPTSNNFNEGLCAWNSGYVESHFDQVYAIGIGDAESLDGNPDFPQYGSLNAFVDNPAGNHTGNSVHISNPGQLEKALINTIDNTESPVSFINPTPFGNEKSGNSKPVMGSNDADRGIAAPYVEGPVNLSGLRPQDIGDDEPLILRENTNKKAIAFGDVLKDDNDKIFGCYDNTAATKEHNPLPKLRIFSEPVQNGHPA